VPDHALRYQFAGHDVNEEICPKNRLQTAFERLQKLGNFSRVLFDMIADGVESH
jgi:hypothetical protein